MRFRRIISELHRRSVWQVLGSYAVVAWLILQLAETLESLIGLPLWFGPVVVAVVLMGFPVLLVTALTQGGRPDVDPEGARFKDGGDGADSSLASWKPLETRPLRDALDHVFTWRHAIVGGAVMASLLTIGTVGYSGMRSAGIGSFGSLVAKDVFEINERIILSDFEDVTADGALGETVTALFRIDLRQSSSVHLLDRDELSPALVRMQRDPDGPLSPEVALELAQREGIKAVMAGEVLPLGPGAVVAVRLIAAETGETLVALRETARTLEAVPDAVDRLSAQLRERIGDPLKNIQGDPPLEEVTTGSLEALRKYVLAEGAAEMGDVETAEALVNEAIALDSSFSMAYRKLGVILSNQGGNQEEAREALTRAFEGRDRLPDRERLLAEAAYHTYVTEDIEAAIESYRGVLAVHPGDGIAGNNLAVLYGERDELEKAADLHVRAIEHGHATALSYTNAVFTLYKAGQADSAKVVLATFKEAYPDHPQGTQYQAALAGAEFDYESAEGFVRELMEAEAGTPRWEMWGRAELASYAMVRGRVKEGLRGILHAYDLQEKAGTRFLAQPRSIFQALGAARIQLHFLLDSEAAVQTLEIVLAGPALGSVDPKARAHLEFATLFAQAGRPDRARERLDAFRTELLATDPDDGEGRADLMFAEAAIALSEERAPESVRLYREAMALVPRCDFCGLPELGEAFEAVAMPDSAVATYEAYLGIPALFRSQGDNVRLHRVLLGLSRSYEALAQPERASDYYRWLLELWEDADPGFQPRVRILQAKLRSLGEP